MLVLEIDRKKKSRSDVEALDGCMVGRQKGIMQTRRETLRERERERDDYGVTRHGVVSGSTTLLPHSLSLFVLSWILTPDSRRKKPDAAHFFFNFGF